MLYSPKCPRGCVVAKGQWKGKPRTPAQALHWSNHLTALLSQLPNYGWKENTRNYVKPTPTANLSSEHGCSTWAMLPDWGSQSRSGNVPFMALVPGFAVTFQACSIMLNSWTTRLSWAGATEATRVWAGAAKKAQDALRLSELAWIVPSEAQQLPASRHWDATQWGATSVKQEMQIFRGTRTSAGWCPLLHAYCWKKVWLSEVPCQHTTSSQHVQACWIGLETTSNTARGVFRAIPCGLCHRIPVLPQWEALLCSKSRFYHIGSVPEVLLLENIILSPTDVSQEPCHSGAVSASSCSWLFLVSMFPPSKHVT